MFLTTEKSNICSVLRFAFSDRVRSLSYADRENMFLKVLIGDESSPTYGAVLKHLYPTSELKYFS